MKKKLNKLFAVLFWVCGGILTSIILIGLMSSGVKTQRIQQVFVAERALPVEAVRGVKVDAYLTNLGHEPRLVIEAEGLPGQAPLKLFLVDTAGNAPSLALDRPLAVNHEREGHGKFKVPEGALSRYGQVVATQRGRVVFRAGLG